MRLRVGVVVSPMRDFPGVLGGLRGEREDDG